MRITLVTYGSEGDTRPFVALGRGLMAAGHEVLLFAEKSCLGTADAFDVPARALQGDLQSILPLDNPGDELTAGAFIATLRASFRIINGNTEAWMRAVTAHARDSDVVLYSSLAAATGETVALALDKPAIGLWLQPTTPTAQFAASTFPTLSLPGWLNRLSYRAAPEALVRSFYGKATRAASAAVFGRGITLARRSTHPIFYGFSRHLVERPRDWPMSHRICGHWSLPPSQWQPPPALRNFLNAGPPPIYVGFGAMASFFRQKRLNEIAAAAAGRRVVFFPGWSRITAGMLPDSFFMLADTPHDWLLPRTSMVIHHGGAGTSHAAARAGVPSVVLPVAVDQFFWAGRLVALGVAPPYIRAAKLDARLLARSMDAAASDSLRARARELAEALAAEHGVPNAVRAIEAHVAACHRAAAPQGHS